MSVVSYCATFLLGVATGAAGTYFADKFTDQRRSSERNRERMKNFLDVRSQMPELIAEMKDDLSSDELKLCREFFVESKNILISSKTKKRFIYFKEDHDSILEKAALLESYDFVDDITTGNVKLYRMTEEFVKFVLSS